MNTTTRQDTSSHAHDNSSGDGSSGSKKRERSNSLLASVPIEEVVNNFSNNPHNSHPDYVRSNSGGKINESFDMSSVATDDYYQSSMSSVSVTDLHDSWRNISMTEKVPFMKSRKTKDQDVPTHVPSQNDYGRRLSSPAELLHDAEETLELLGDSDSDDTLSEMKTMNESHNSFACTGTITQPRGIIQNREKELTQNDAVSMDTMHRVKSTPALFSTGFPEVNIFANGTATMLTDPDLALDPSNETNPHEFLKRIVESSGYSSKSLPGLSVESYFIEHTSEQIEAYDNRITTAVRAEDVETLKQIYTEGRPLQCSNRFGESIVHMACRRGSAKVLRFLLEVGNVSGLVRDDFGRTPMHDACWTREPDFEIVKMLTDRWPDLFLVSDKRGHTPLQYVRRDHWGKWCHFLTEYRDRLAPRAIAEKTCL
eukprot:CAMPEP_0185734930 /NCGR_PEP_ID=MMETSP1171-20130828/23865_1 /TAXON_ID=374046 /ORGANISM="Helicotheca tamensis, Strain CCMP826" /LENGTH=425 /DNA_ID=CAMNT_0028405063 /DNA_START=155 /DNA_END=1432 /DNA_ORIENTATION=+